MRADERDELCVITIRFGRFGHTTTVHGRSICGVVATTLPGWWWEMCATKRFLAVDDGRMGEMMERGASTHSWPTNYFASVFGKEQLILLRRVCIYGTSYIDRKNIQRAERLCLHSLCSVQIMHLRWCEMHKCLANQKAKYVYNVMVCILIVELFMYAKRRFYVWNFL